MTSPSHEGLGTVRTRSGDTLADALEAVLKLVEARGVRISPQSRLYSYLALLRSRGTEILEQASHAHHEADEIVTAVEHVARDPEVRNWPTMFRDIQCGALIAPLRHDRAREKQTELLMGGLMRSAGATVTFEEPDAKAVVDGNALSFAAKRPTSVTNLQKNARDGRNQLSRAGGSGVLFLDITPLASEHSRVYVVPSLEYAVQAFDASLDSTMRKYSTPLVTWFRAAPGRQKTVAALMTLLNLRFVVPSVGRAKTLFGSLRRMHADAVASGDFVPKWLFEFVLRFNRIGVSSS